jgi:hypothetical protein
MDDAEEQRISRRLWKQQGWRLAAQAKGWASESSDTPKISVSVQWFLQQGVFAQPYNGRVDLPQSGSATTSLFHDEAYRPDAQNIQENGRNRSHYPSDVIQFILHAHNCFEAQRENSGTSGRAPARLLVA